MPVTVKTGPTAEPVSLVDMKLHLRVEHNDEDAYIEGLITTARRYAEQTLCHRSFAQQTLVYTTHAFRPVFKLPRGPVTSIVEFKYKDAEGASHELTEDVDFVVDYQSIPALVLPKDTWPTAELHPINAITIEYEAGYTAVPEELKHWLKILVAHWYENREAVLPMGHNVARTPYAIDWLLEGYRTFGAGDD